MLYHLANIMSSPTLSAKDRSGAHPADFSSSGVSIRIPAAISYPKWPSQDTSAPWYLYMRDAERLVGSTGPFLAVCLCRGRQSFRYLATVLLARKRFSYLRRLSKLSRLGCGGITHHPRPQLTCGSTNGDSGGATQARDSNGGGVTITPWRN